MCTILLFPWSPTPQLIRLCFRTIVWYSVGKKSCLDNPVISIPLYYVCLHAQNRNAPLFLSPLFPPRLTRDDIRLELSPFFIFVFILPSQLYARRSCSPRRKRSTPLHSTPLHSTPLHFTPTIHTYIHRAKAPHLPSSKTPPKNLHVYVCTRTNQNTHTPILLHQSYYTNPTTPILLHQSYLHLLLPLPSPIIIIDIWI